MAAGQTVLQIPSASTGLTAKLHPTVLFNICDSYVRRNDQAERVIGTLLGSVSSDGTVDIRNSYCVPHNESSDQVAVDIDYHRNMYELHQRVNPKEVIVGWYSTGSGVSGSSALIQDFYAREVTNPVHLTVDTRFENIEASIRAYVSTILSLGDRQLAAQFHEIPLDLRMVEAERVGFDVLKKTIVDKLPNDLEGLEATMERLLALIEDVFKYVDDVVRGQIAPENNVGRYLMDTMAAIPKMSSDAFDKLFNDSIQDLLLVIYLAGLTKSQLTLAEKLNTAAQIL
ncbi:eukaryotic translation initiation factor 3 subunit F isoform X2 [Cryptomeria japonica]|nr:eukaryotic translation initiation factor 3 subunit F isoform X2 [Cryptomeria japonica]XP_057868246.1 eukaryotic translation initiation factor 3 subunit F isoform X2 [Cryptomeria japonica]XP_059075534.1 eukaryotic translation initiation factor 3 subunit F isoform X2 [Cryptomeria japonica]